MAAAVSQSLPNYFSSSGSRRSYRREQAAAVCYRVGARGIEFLLVRTRGGRWTFPKGGIEPGLTYAQSAAVEAFEEAGVHGRIELAAFARYLRRGSSKSPAKSTLVFTFLCEVLRLAKPQESKRERTWFSAEMAKRRLQEGRSPQCGNELAAVVDRAVSRVGRLSTRCEDGPAVPDALQKVCFEASAAPISKRTASQLASDLRREFRPSPSIERALNAHIQRFLPVSGQRPLLRLGNGTTQSADPVLNVTTIDGVRGKISRKS